MNFFTTLKTWIAGKAEPEHLRRGKLGERAARRHLQRLGLKFLAANFRSTRGEIDLIFRTGERFTPAEKPKSVSKRLNNTVRFLFGGKGTDCLVFVEVKTRSSEEWTRPASAVDARKRRLLSQTALDYLKLLHHPQVKVRFDIVEVLLTDGAVREVRHLPNTFPLSQPYRYG
jgi:putative endonuclease